MEKEKVEKVEKVRASPLSRPLLERAKAVTPILGHPLVKAKEATSLLVLQVTAKEARAKEARAKEAIPRKSPRVERVRVVVVTDVRRLRKERQSRLEKEKEKEMVRVRVERAKDYPAVYSKRWKLHTPPNLERTRQEPENDLFNSERGSLSQSFSFKRSDIYYGARDICKNNFIKNFR
jgi:hypothetical protein